MKKTIVGFIAPLVLLQGVPVFAFAEGESLPGVEAKKPSVLFIPGIMGSRLYKEGFLSEDKLWLPNHFEGVVADLGMNKDGESRSSGVYTKYDDIIERAYAAEEMYSGIVDSMKEMKEFDEIADYRVAPYDWRYGADRVVDYGAMEGSKIFFSRYGGESAFILRQLKDLCANQDSAGVTIIAHSNGGLVAKALLSKDVNLAMSCVKNLVLVTSPQLGTPEAIGTILHGYNPPIPAWMNLLSWKDLRTLATNMPGAYGLLPSAKYFETVSKPVITFDRAIIPPGQEGRIQTHEGMRSFMVNPIRSKKPGVQEDPLPANEKLLTDASQLHAGRLDDWLPPSGVRVVEIGGAGLNTVTGIHYDIGQVSSCTKRVMLDCLKVAREQVLLARPVVDDVGDGTVVLPSALGMPLEAQSEKIVADLEASNKSCDADVNHSKIFKNDRLLAYIRMNLVAGAAHALPNHISSLSDYQEGGWWEDADTLWYELHSPLHLSVRATAGGVVSSTTNTIKGGRFDRYGEVQVISLPKGIPHVIQLDGYKEGSFTFIAEERRGDQSVIASTTFSAIPIENGARVTVGMPNGNLQSMGLMKIDTNGDGYVDHELTPIPGGVAYLDTTAPEAVISYDPVTEKIAVRGIDEGGSVRVVTSATSSLLTDPSGNTLLVPFTLKKETKGVSQVAFREVYHNGVKVDVGSIEAQFGSQSTHGTLHNACGEVKITNMTQTTGMHAVYNGKQNTTMVTEGSGKPARVSGLHLPFIRVHTDAVIERN